MKPIVRQRSLLSFAEKLSRLAGRLREPQWRRYGATILAGKLAGVGMTLAMMAAVTGLFFAKVYAADAPLKAADVVNPINTAWTLIAPRSGTPIPFQVVSESLGRDQLLNSVAIEVTIRLLLQEYRSALLMILHQGENESFCRPFKYSSDYLSAHPPETQWQ